MERAIRPSFFYVSRSYYLLTKPGIIMGNAITAIGGFVLASKTAFSWPLFLFTLAGLSLIIASACIVNNCMDRKLDAKMARTKNRPLVQGTVTISQAALLAGFLGSLGGVVLALWVGVLAFVLAFVGFFVYVVLYTLSKAQSTHATLIGSIAGAIPPIVGYCAAAHRFDLGAALLFLIMVSWQMPHFFAIAIYRIKDYTAASLPLLPIKKGIQKTKMQMTLYLLFFLVSLSMLTFFHYTNLFYLISSLALGIYWLIICIKGFNCKNDAVWARKMFIVSLFVIISIFLVIPIDLFLSKIFL